MTNFKRQDKVKFFDQRTGQWVEESAEGHLGLGRPGAAPPTERNFKVGDLVRARAGDLFHHNGALGLIIKLDKSDRFKRHGVYLDGYATVLWTDGDADLWRWSDLDKM